MNGLNYTHNVSPDLLTAKDIDHQLPTKYHKRIGRTIYEGKKSYKNKANTFEAISKVTKATIEKHEEALKYGEAWSKSSHDIAFYNPTVIFDGLLFEGYLNSRGELKLNEINYIPFMFNYISTAYKHDFSHYFIDIVTFKGLNTYIKRQEKWINDIYSTIDRNLDSS